MESVVEENDIYTYLQTKVDYIIVDRMLLNRVYANDVERLCSYWLSVYCTVIQLYCYKKHNVIR